MMIDFESSHIVLTTGYIYLKEEVYNFSRQRDYSYADHSRLHEENNIPSKLPKFGR